MIRIARSTPTAPAWHVAFLAMLPTIVRYARVAFRHLHGEAREDALQEVVANALVAFARLVELGKQSLAYPTVLTRYAVAQYRDGRRVGCKSNVRDVMSPHCQKRKKSHVERLDRFDEEENEWKEALVQDTRSATVPDTVSFRIDFSDWLRSLPERDRQITKSLSMGNRTSDVANRFNVSAGRVSQLRGELAASWREFVGDAAAVRDQS